MKRKSIIFAILCVLMLVSGCSSQSADDIYQMMGNASSKSNGSVPAYRVLHRLLKS